ncbi:hypothetical protein BDDG_02338 [Blastomyces dermatitidis ATCC 18188]|uniref:Protein kinase domain-containing protein n=1 Tax=Ajellomyces dermatitidis (strain ATCC 18188 / CBS 674.68) TaxID=653446 RepID=F2T836_AJEDA|nr:hypothetical protein BDDG_02338 [Blastomyces dermatitidis ATCC 18188]
MADDEIQRLRQLVEDVEQARQDEKRRRQDAEQALEDEKRRRQVLAEQIRPLTLFEYLDACHTYLFRGLVPGNTKHSTKGSADNADGKLRPHRLREWLLFANAQTEIWDQLLNQENEEFIMQPKFDSLNVIMAQGKKTWKIIHSELDLHYFQQDVITEPVEAIIAAFFENERLRHVFGLQGQIAFENHTNTLSDSEEDKRVVACPSKLQEGTEGAATPITSPASARPLADEFCIYNKGEKVEIPALIDMELDEVVELRCDDTEKIKDQRSVAAVITQAFSYMVKAGVEYGYVSTGEAFIFLHFKADEPGTVYYYLSVPETDVGKETGFTGEFEGDDNKLHMTAVGQLNVWVVTEEDLYPSTQEEDERSLTPYTLRKSAQIFVRNSPVRTRSLAARQRPHQPADFMVVVPPPPTWASSHKGPVCKDGTRQYCTQKCLLGLLNGGPLDRACPNVKEHGANVHKIDHSTFLSLLMAQILQEIVDPWTDPLGCESLHRHGSRGALFEVILFQYGYTLIGKGFPPEFGHYLRHEKALYDQLKPIQGLHVPVCLGTIDVSKRPMFYDGIADIPHFLLLAHAGTNVSECDVSEDQIVSAASKSLQAIHALGVLHHDAETRNLFWSEEGENVLVIDFERAEILRPKRALLGNTPPNRKRKRGGESMVKETKVDVRRKWIDTKFERELKGMVEYLNTYLKS